MKNLMTALLISLAANVASAQDPGTHKMQHGFILSDDDTFATHLVANGHHSWQTDVSGELIISSDEEQAVYQKRKLENIPTRKTYFLFQAQQIALAEVTVGQEFTGYIIESKVGDYEPKNIVVTSAKFIVKAVHLNIENPFFKE